MQQMFSTGERSGLQAGQSNTWTLSPQSHAVVIDVLCGLALSCWNIQGLPWKRRLTIWEHMLLPYIPIYLSALMAFHKHYKWRLLNSKLIMSQTFPLLYSPEDAVSMISKKHMKFEFVWPQNSFPLILAQRKQLCFCIMFTYGFLFAG